MLPHKGSPLIYTTFILICLLWIASYLNILTTLVAEWTENGSYNHGFLTLAITIYTLYISRRSISNNNVLFRIKFLPIVLIAGLIWLLSTILDVLTLSQISSYLIFLSLNLCFYGLKTCKKLLFPFILPIFSFPIFNIFQPPLQDISTALTTHTLDLLNVPNFVNNNYVTVPGGVFHIDVSCSGLGFILTSIVLGLTISYFERLSPPKIMALLASAIGFSIFANWLRIVIIILIGNSTNMKHPIVEDHVTFGWLIFAVLLVPLVYLFYRFSKRNTEILTAKTSLKYSEKNGRQNIQFIPFLFMLTLPAFPLSYKLLEMRSPKSSSNYNFADSCPYVETSSTNSYFYAHYPGASSHFTKTFIINETIVDVVLINHDRQIQGKELLYVGNRIYNSDIWQLKDKLTPLFTYNKRDHNYNLLILYNEIETTRALSYFYVVNETITHSWLDTKIQEILAYLLQNDRSGSVISIRPNANFREVSKIYEELRAYNENIFNCIIPLESDISEFNEK